MLSTRTGTILKSIVGQYIDKAIPVPSQYIATDPELMVSPATIRNEMAHLEQEGYIIRPHISAGSVPSDKGYRYYVESLENIQLPQAEQRFVSHLFHQVEKEVEQWLNLASTLLAQLVKNLAVVTLPKSMDCKFKHIELVSMRDSLALLVLILYGAKVKQKLITFNEVVTQLELTAIANKLNDYYSGLAGGQIKATDKELSQAEQQITDLTVEIMRAEDEQELEEPHLDGLHFILGQPEFTGGHQGCNLMELVEQRNLLKAIIPHEPPYYRLHIIIGKENEAEALHNYSVVLSQYGIPDEAMGTLGVIGPTRMAYAHAIPTVNYLSSILSELVSGLYGK
jgi:heat-inducible transcriptional repressor